jgi:DNA-binding transcriptional regulator GbsR (MarR family)
MSLSPDSPLPSHYRSKQEFLASLSPWRRQLANLNWHPTVDMKVQSYALEQQAIEREQRMKQLRNETEQLRNETEQLRKENARLSELDAKLNAILSNSGTSSTPPNAMPGESEM